MFFGMGEERGWDDDGGGCYIGRRVEYVKCKVEYEL